MPILFSRVFLLSLNLQNMITCFTVFLCQPHEQFGDETSGTRYLCRKAARPIFSERICMASALSALARVSCNLMRFLESEPDCAGVGTGVRS